MAPSKGFWLNHGHAVASSEVFGRPSAFISIARELAVSAEPVHSLKVSPLELRLRPLGK